METTTLPPSSAGFRPEAAERDQVPGVIVVFSGRAACARVIPIEGGALELGRADGRAGTIDDGRVSRHHARVAFESWRCVVTDLNSQNGTFVDGMIAPAGAPTPVQRVIRVGDSLLIPCPNVLPFERAGVQLIDGFVRGPAMQRVLEEAARAIRGGTTLHVHGESGTGKEGVAHAFHRAGKYGARALVAVNCGAIPLALAESLLFGAKRGTYSSLEADARGYVQEADGSTLFLDEIAELDHQVQTKLLRVLESRELLRLGESRPRKVDFALCSATSKDLRALVAAGTVREDLYFRVARPTVTVPALRNRPEEIPALIAHELAKLSPAPTAHVSLVEHCLLRPWPGNVRELLGEIRAAAQAALVDGRRVELRHLAPSAGMLFARGSERPAPAPGQHRGHDASSRSAAPPRTQPGDDDERRRIVAALAAHGGNVSAAARALGMHRTQLRRVIERHDIAVDALTSRDDDDPLD